MASSYTLGSHFEGFIQTMLESGRYASASELLRHGLRLIEEQEQTRLAKLHALRKDIQAGFDSGPSEVLDMSEIKMAALQQHLNS